MKSKGLVASVVSAVVSAVLLFASFPPLGEKVDILFALVPILIVSRLSNVKRSAMIWGLAGVLFWGSSLSWLVAISKNGGPLPLVILGLIGLSAICGAYFAAFGALDAMMWRRVSCLHSIRARRIVRIVCLLLIEPILWAGLEWVRGWLFTGFAWNYLGTAAAQFPQYALAARFGGVYLVSAMVLVVNGVFATLIERVIVRMLPKEDADENIGVYFIRVTRNLETALPLILVASLVYFGEQDVIRNAPEETIPVKATLVQRNASCVFQQAQKRENSYEEFGALLATCKYSKPDLVVWAESAMSEFGHLKHPRAYDAVRFVEQKTDGAALFTGGDYYCFTNGERRVYNGGAIYHPKNLQDPDVEIYSKRHLVPFGEYIPLDKWITPLQKLSPIGVSLYPGESTTVKLNLKRVDERGLTNKTSVTLGPLICFEDTPPSLARASAKDGAQLLVLITNDSWFSYSVEAEQHAWQSVMRSIETGLPMVRAGNSGVTGSITSRGFTNWLYDGNGKLLVDAKGSQTVIVNVPKNPKKTLYVKLGDYPLMFLFLTCLGLLFFPPAKSRIFARD